MKVFYREIDDCNECPNMDRSRSIFGDKHEGMMPIYCSAHANQGFSALVGYRASAAPGEPKGPFGKKLTPPEWCPLPDKEGWNPDERH